ncbi:ATP-binding protein [Streptomyces sp. NPDC088400]|uniref:ATP-binding protein n=1 Tax=Streptomyces sp. NPDC088400 TaxID=3365861 RepID=UPI003824A199
MPLTIVRPIGHPGYNETLPREPESAATARRLVRAACAAWELEELAEDGALIVSELVSNAVQHARRESIRVVIDRPGVTCVCCDWSVHRIGGHDTPRDAPRRPRSAGTGSSGLSLDQAGPESYRVRSSAARMMLSVSIPWWR